VTLDVAVTGKVSDLGASEFSSRIMTNGLGIRIGPFNAHIRVPIPAIQQALYCLYSDYPLQDLNSVFSFHAHLARTRKFPRLYRPLVRFSIDGRVPHEDMPLEQALPVLEWGMNLVIAMRSHCFLLLHAAVLEKRGYAILLPAAPGMGKTTLCSALAHRGWRLLSDEFGMIRPGTEELVPVPRPMALKNDSINVLRTFAPDAVISPPVQNTRKGTVAHVKPPEDSVQKQSITARAKWIVFPRWQADAGLSLEPLSRSQGFMMLAMNAFNYDLIGESAFRTVSKVVSASNCYRLVYSDLDEAIVCIDQLANNDG